MLLSIFLFLGRCFAGAEGGSRVSQGVLNPDCDWVRATEHAPCGRLHLLERTHGLAEIVERGAVVAVLGLAATDPKAENVVLDMFAGV